MEKNNLYLIAKGNTFILKCSSSYALLLSENDLDVLSFHPDSKDYCGTLEENGEIQHALYIARINEDIVLESEYISVTSEDLFEKQLYPSQRLAISKMISGAKNIAIVASLKDDKLMNAYERVNISRPKAFFLHLRTVNRHRRLVRKHCFKVGLYYQGLVHDLSKYSPSEFLMGVRYYQGTRSPNVAERSITGYSSAWMHHKGRNKHHYEYWTDYSIKTGNPLEFCKMPRRYFVESLMDRIAASKVYRGKLYNDGDSLEYLLTRDSESHMNPENHAELLRILTMLKEKGEEETFRYIRREYLKEKEG